MPDDLERPDAVASATAPAFPSLKKDNCISNGRYRSVFVAQENIRLFIWKTGEQNVGALTVTAADCLSVREFQSKWHSYLNALKRELHSGMWTRERQPRSGNWHAHSAVNVGWDIQTGFPRDQVARGFYANVDPQLRALWKYLREKAASHGFGRVELLPLKYSGAACARYFTKYLTKAVGSDKLVGEERCRLFGVWGGRRFVYSRFSFGSSRIIQRKKQWLADTLGYKSPAAIANVTPHWWFHFGRTLADVVLPNEYYMVETNDGFVWDDIGLAAIQRDWRKWPEPPSDDLMLRSQFNLLSQIGDFMHPGDRSQALAFVYSCMAQHDTTPVQPACDPQLLLKLPRQMAWRG